MCYPWYFCPISCPDVEQHSRNESDVWSSSFTVLYFTTDPIFVELLFLEEDVELENDFAVQMSSSRKLMVLTQKEMKYL